MSSSQEKAQPKQPETKQAGTYGKHATMPVLQADNYKEINLPQLQPFNCEDIKLDATILAIGKRRTGKSWCFRDLMFRMKEKIPAGIVISQTDDLNKFWRQYIPKKYIYKKYEPEILDAVFKRQRSILNDKNLTDKEKEEQAPFFVLLDDVISDKRLQFDENLMELFVAGRHYKLFVLITSQYAKGVITPTIRGNTDYVFIMKTIQGRQRESLWEDFADFLTKDAWNRMLDAYTEDNEVLVVDTCPEHTVTPEDMMYWWKAQDPGNFKMGSKAYWESALQDNSVPSKEAPIAASQLMSVKDVMPPPWDQYVQ